MRGFPGHEARGSHCGALVLVIAGCVALGADPAAAFDAPRGAEAASTAEVVAAGTAPEPLPPVPFDAPEPDDRTFVVDAGPSLDTGCLFRSQGPIVFELEVGRYAGELRADGTLRYAADLVRAGLLGGTARLYLAVYDVDAAQVVTPPDQPEIDIVEFNGEPIDVVIGSNDRWGVAQIDIPIEKVKFPRLPPEGGTPEPARNQVRIHIDAGNEQDGKELWCTAVAWAALQVRVMSPILLVHGNNADGDFYARQGFASQLRSRRFVYAGTGESGLPIDLDTDTIAANGERLAGLIPAIAGRFGVDSVHLVVHSKGGLDAREYMANYLTDDLDVVSFTSLATPHNGSVGADILVKRDLAARNAAKVEFENIPFLDRFIAERMGIDPGTPNLTTAFVARFDAGNRARLPSATIYQTVGADADVDGDGEIKDFVEYRAMLPENESLAALPRLAQGTVVNRVYRILRDTARVHVGFRDQGIGPFRRVVATVTLVDATSPQGNDTLVTIPSAHGIGSFESVVSGRLSLQGSSGRNHANVGDADVAARVLPSIVRAERVRGDLR